MIIVFALAIAAHGSIKTISGQATTTKKIERSYLPPNGFVPDSITAIRIAEAVLAPIYPARVLDTERPFKAALTGDIWTVEGTLPQGSGGIEYIGGVATVKIRKADGRILQVSHGK